MYAGNLVLVLHTHLPYVVHHGEWPHGTDWLCEAIAECYIPLMNCFNELLDEGITPKVSLDISPVLCEQLEHPELPEIFIRYCDQKIEAAKVDYEFFRNDRNEAHFAPLAKMWADWFETRKQEFITKYKKSVVGGLKALQDKGAIEIMTCGVTHGYYPLLGNDKSINMQVKASVENYKKHFGRAPRGTWIPECAYRPGYEWRTYLLSPHHQVPRYRPGVETFLSEHGIEFFVVDQGSTGRAQPLGLIAEEDGHKRLVNFYSSEFKPYHFNFDTSAMNIYNVSSDGDLSKGTAVAFTRHQEVAMQVWSGEKGYPGEPDFLDFHKKHYRSSLRYWRVTDAKVDMQYKQPYNPDWVWGKLEKQAHHFVQCIEGTVRHYKQQSGKDATLCLPFDTELFGHWWFEGPYFIKLLLRGLHYSPYVNLATASEELDKMKPREVMRMPESSWGAGGHHEVWINKDTQWTWQLMYDCESRFDKLMGEKSVADLTDLEHRILLQALRELLLLQASDWQFLITNWSARDYAERRYLFHYSDFTKLCEMVELLRKGEQLSEHNITDLAAVENLNSVFAEIRLEWWNKEPLVERTPPAKKAPTTKASAKTPTAKAGAKKTGTKK